MKTAFPGIDGADETRRISSFIKSMVQSSSASGVVVGLSGGIDSSVVGAACVRALGKHKVVGMMMPSSHTPKEDIDDASTLVRKWGIECLKVPISPIASRISSAVGEKGTKLAGANVQARLRMVLLYYVANSRTLLVAGTGDRSEELLGFFTKFGDGGVDFLPIAHLYKTQVRELGRFLGLPENIACKPASPQLWPGHRATQELPADYDKLDVILHSLFDEKASPKTAALNAGVPLKVVESVIEMHSRSEHKRGMPPSLV